MELLNTELSYNVTKLECTKQPGPISREIKRIINLGADVNIIAFERAVYLSINTAPDVIQAFIHADAAPRRTSISYICSSLSSKQTMKTLLDVEFCYAVSNYNYCIGLAVILISLPVNLQVNLHKTRVFYEIEYTCVLDMLIGAHF